MLQRNQELMSLKGCALPARVDGIRGYAPTQGRSPGMIRVLPPVGRSRHRTSGGTAANWSFHTVNHESRFATANENRTRNGQAETTEFYFHKGLGSDWLQRAIHKPFNARAAA